MPHIPLIIRQATRDDAGILSEMGARTFQDNYAGQNTPEDIEEYIHKWFSLDQIWGEIDDLRNQFLLGLGDDQFIGYAKLAKSTPPQSVKGSKPLELARIYVEQAWIGMGFGSALMQAAIATAIELGHGTLWLGVWQENSRAIRFYLKWGFLMVGTQHFLLGSDLQDDYVLALSLPPP